MQTFTHRHPEHTGNGCGPRGETDPMNPQHAPMGNPVRELATANLRGITQLVELLATIRNAICNSQPGAKQGMANGTNIQPDLRGTLLDTEQSLKAAIGVAEEIGGLIGL